MRSATVVTLGLRVVAIWSKVANLTTPDTAVLRVLVCQMTSLVAPLATAVGTFLPPMANLAAFCARVGFCAIRRVTACLLAVSAGDVNFGFFVSTLLLTLACRALEMGAPCPNYLQMLHHASTLVGGQLKKS